MTVQQPTNLLRSLSTKHFLYKLLSCINKVELDRARGSALEVAPSLWRRVCFRFSLFFSTLSVLFYLTVSMFYVMFYFSFNCQIMTHQFLFGKFKYYLRTLYKDNKGRGHTNLGFTLYTQHTQKGLY